MEHCILLNADYSFLNVVGWRRAICLVAKNKVQVLKYAEREIRGVEGLVLKVPAVMRLIHLIRAVYRARVPFSKKNVLIRDGFKCAYCGTRTGHLTVDHITPRSRGGPSTFENCVASCRPCNSRKGSRTPREAGMRLSARPFQPTISEFLRMRLSRLGIDDLFREIGLA
ncbi:MAG: HNH endonuclease [Desulfobacterales bacterium]